MSNLGIEVVKTHHLSCAGLLILGVFWRSNLFSEEVYGYRKWLENVYCVAKT